jgi:hypothetical protein
MQIKEEELMTKHGMHGTPEYAAWRNMRGRCAHDSNYVARYITVCEQWTHSFANFFADVGLKPSPDHTLDRIDNDGNYEPGNVRWATRTEQGGNRSNNSIWGVGIRQHPDRRFRAYIILRGRKFRLGAFDTQEKAVAVRAEFERLATPLLAQLAASKAETARLKKQNDSDEFRRVATSDTVN